MLLRVCTAGNVDDGKSTLIGRLLYEAKAIPTDILRDIEKISAERGFLDLSLLTDGLRRERQERITVDVAYRPFNLGDTRIILADGPGHTQFMQNTATGASTADVLVLLVDILHGFTDQAKKHLHIADVLLVPNLIVCVNKWDAVEFSYEKFLSLETEIRSFIKNCSFKTSSIIPISAITGEGITAYTKSVIHTPLIEYFKSIKPAKYQGVPWAWVQNNIDGRMFCIKYGDFDTASLVDVEFQTKNYFSARGDQPRGTCLGELRHASKFTCNLLAFSSCPINVLLKHRSGYVNAEIIGDMVILEHEIPYLLYSECRELGSFILIKDNETFGAGVIV